MKIESNLILSQDSFTTGKGQTEHKCGVILTKQYLLILTIYLLCALDPLIYPSID